MFPLIGILLAAALLFKTRKKPPVVAPVATDKATAKPVITPTVKATVKPAAKPNKATAKTTAKAPVSSIEGLPSATQTVSDIFGSMRRTNPKVLSPSLPYGYYDPSTNSTGQTPPIVAPTVYTDR